MPNFPNRPMAEEQKRLHTLQQRLKGIRKFRNDIQDKPAEERSVYERALLTHPPVRDTLVDNPLIPKVERPAANKPPAAPPAPVEAAPAPPTETPAERLRRLLDEHRKRLEAERAAIHHKTPTAEAASDDEDDEDEDDEETPVPPTNKDDDSPSARLAKYLEERRRQEAATPTPPEPVPPAPPPPVTATPVVNELPAESFPAPPPLSRNERLVQKVKAHWALWEPKIYPYWHRALGCILWTLIVLAFLREIMLAVLRFDIASTLHWSYLQQALDRGITLPWGYIYLPIAPAIFWLAGLYALLMTPLWRRLEKPMRHVSKLVLLPITIMLLGIEALLMRDKKLTLDKKQNN